MMEDGTLDPAKAPAILNGTFSKLSSQLAVENATGQAVQDFAGLEVAEQAAVATAFGVPASIPGDKAAMYEQLQAATGAEFDRMYIEGQIAGHEELQSIHEEYAANGTDPIARGASMVGVTGIDSHLAMLRTIQASLT